MFHETQFFRQNGFVVFRSLFSDTEIKPISDEVDKIINGRAAWSGDRVTGGRGGLIDLRLKRGVIDHRPSVVTIMLGMNDGNVAPFEAMLFSTFGSRPSGIRPIPDSPPGSFCSTCWIYRLLVRITT